MAIQPGEQKMRKARGHTAWRTRDTWPYSLENTRCEKHVHTLHFEQEQNQRMVFLAGGWAQWAGYIGGWMRGPYMTTQHEHVSTIWSGWGDK